MEFSPLAVMLLLISLIPVPHAQEDPQAVLSVSPQSWLTEGDSVTLSCEVTDSSTDWTFRWYTVVPYRHNENIIVSRPVLLSDSSRGSGDSYTISPAALKHTGVYECRAERGERVYHTRFSNQQPLWITGESPPVSLIINPNRTQHFTNDSLSLSCEDQSNSTGWRVSRYTDSGGMLDCSQWGSVTGSTCEISFRSTYYTGVYWCASESGENSNPVNITVHDGDVILESPVHPVTEGHPLILRCLYRKTKSSYLRANFYKDGSVLQTQTTGKMIIYNVSKSDEGFYHCKHPKRGESPKSWVSVREGPQVVLSVSPQSWLTEGDSVTLSCEVTDSSTDWTFSWYTAVPDKHNENIIVSRLVPLSDSSRESGDSYTISPAALNHTGVYECRAERGERVYQTRYSNQQPLWITGESPPVSLIINPKRTQHFTKDSLSLNCEDQSNSTGWTLSRYTDSERVLDCSQWGSVTGSTCEISFRSTYYTGVYWCESESGENSNPVNITVHDGDVILESPVHPVTEGHPLILRCLYRKTKSSYLRAHFYKDGSVIQTQTKRQMIIYNVSKSDEGFYHCKHPERGESPKSWVSVRVLISLIPVPHAQGSPKAVVSLKPDTLVYSGETVTFSCDIQGGGDTEWTYSWYRNNYTHHFSRFNMFDTDSTMQEISIWFVRQSDSGDFTCRGQSNDSQSSEISDVVTLTVSERPQVVLSVSPQNWLTEGDSVTLSCEVTDSSTDWTFSWYTVVPYRHIEVFFWYRVVRLSDSSRESGDSYTISPAALNHTGVYWCSAGRGEMGGFSTYNSNQQPLWITGKSPPVSLIINPKRTQHFTKDSLSLSCEDQSNSTGWTVRRYKDGERVSHCSWWGSVTGSTCNIRFLSTSYTGDYWCESESGEISNPVNITVHDGDVILESPVHPVTEGHPLILRCLYRNKKSSNLRADFYKDGSVLQTQTTGEMIIQTVSKSDEGFYHCKHPERGESPKSWVSVRVLISLIPVLHAQDSKMQEISIGSVRDSDRGDYTCRGQSNDSQSSDISDAVTLTVASGSSGVEAPFSVLMLISSVVTAFLLVTIILLVKCYRARAHTGEYRIQNAVIKE
ncbi:hypothetical protein AMELA_G00057940 [Ameiurus melas]|uniref:Ig-like domain-containing protein n=1 Tax=Ameiurus melas TaxID=219545 RepID=A0A7J6B1F4_AMEME|nr:hypothetical protein AMELA_G00057940 [Ameiurus melas]